ncbi:DNA modification methylase [Mucilaginibacter gossypiicola]|uniref:DNA modification methylase n=1 Tax=Mucilaginibacter gossypiicola TaxID=551995 RepID=A0A1H8EUK1_9SPHI|nr:DNA methyltransferase [Mucilaginibacter gossypiicola]SEN22428.1 DNA modification methylase [Mucilaginibacter gossypiicola]
MEKNYVQANAQVIKIRKELLSLHPLLANIYTYNDVSAVEDLAITIKEVGQREPVIINHNNQILSGGRRWMAINQIDSIAELDAIVIHDNGKDDALNIVCHNQQRAKTKEELVKEAEILLPLLTKRQGQRNDLKRDNATDTFNLKGKDRFEGAGKMIGLSGSSFRQLSNVIEFEKEAEEHKELRILDKVRSGEMSFSVGDKLVKNYRKLKNESCNVVRPLYKASLIEESVKLFNKSCLNMNEVEDETVQVVMTSVPYYGLRNYGNGVDGIPELGLESTPKEFIVNLVSHLKDVRRVLKQSGSFFLNIGETYKDRQALLIPTKLLLTLCQEQGWYLVNEIIWKKKNPIPQSLTNKLHTSYEKIFHLVKDPDNYFYQEFKIWHNNPIKLVKGPGYRDVKDDGNKKEGKWLLTKPYKKFKDFIEEQKVHDVIVGNNASGRQKDLQQLDNTVDHPALFPDYLPVLPILTTSKPGDVVLDPFSGSGTTGRVALLLGRKYIGYELNKENFDLSTLDINKAIQEKSDECMAEIFQMAA